MNKLNYILFEFSMKKVLYWDLITLPVHVLVHSCTSLASPKQFLPLYEGVGLSQVRYRNCNPETKMKYYDSILHFFKYN